ncbi:MAG: acetylornithine/succinylornithine family transaminase [Clostridia bacterium]|nr:acetylornithine/succinylornithine family transaminase [Clostridia bacterium]
MKGFSSIDKEYTASTYKRFDLEIISGKGSILTDSSGKEYIDLGSGIGVTAFGINDEVWKNAVTEQLSKVQHTSNLYYTEPSALLAEALCRKTGFKKVFFSNSGAEANECAIKAARKYGNDTKGEGCYKIVTLVNSFHGRTITTLSATGQDSFHKLFNPLTDGFIHIRANDISALKETLDESVCAVMFEVCQGEGGVIPLEKNFVDEMVKICREKDILLVTDEVQTGNGRTGELYGYMNYGFTPDIVSTAKGLGGGLPIGATLLGDKVKAVFSYGDHGSTFGANPVCCAGALSIINRLDKAFLDEVKAKSEYIFKTLGSLENIESVRGLGLMIGFKAKNKTSAEIVSGCMEKGVLCLTAKDRVRLLPALNIPEATLEKAINVIKEVVEEN